MAHRLLSGAAPRCAVPHGHTQTVEVSIGSVRDKLDPANMIIEFGQVKKRWHGFLDEKVDHAFQVGDRDPLIDYFRRHEPHQLDRLLVTPGDPTTEIVVVILKAKLEAFLAELDPELSCARVTLFETPTNAVSFRGDPRSHLPSSGWWWRADDTINDLEASP